MSREMHGFLVSAGLITLAGVMVAIVTGVIAAKLTKK
jgi:hypothetical protein